MVDIDQYECDRDDCEKAYPHQLLLSKHKLDDHNLDEEIEAVLGGK